MRLSHLGLILPAMRRLWLTRNEPIGELETARHSTAEVAVLQSRLDTLTKELQTAERVKAELEHLHSEDRLLRSQGRRIDFEYGYDPRPRSRETLRRILEPVLAAGAEGYRNQLATFATFTTHLLNIVAQADHAAAGPRWINDHMPGLDAVSIYGFLASLNPRQYVEVGSGNSTLFARQAIQDHGLRTRIISIDPSPRAEVDAICDEVMRTTCEMVEPSLFESLGSEDILFVDNSHRAFSNSDVTVFFTDILPALSPGVLFGIHDIWTPDDYPVEWRDRWYNEQYMLEAYLLGGFQQDDIVLPAAWVSGQAEIMKTLAPLFQDPRLSGVQSHGGAFWLRRRAISKLDA
jgi:methyltransferase family protein